jgi:hypothetical protein
LSDIDRQRLAGTFEGRDWMTIEDLYQASLAGGVFSSQHFAKCLAMHSKSVLRRALKSGRLRQVDGSVIKVASIAIVPEGAKERVRVYKREDLFTIDDYWQVIAYWDRQAKYARKMKRYYTRLATKAHGSNFTKLLPCFKENALP